ncbi:ferrous iron transport protein B [Anaerolineaceae bacterium oral taxon 439]|nr:ferrous iron transport protein B [Anaerolineaceae bacterium oral taxon 439]
MSEIRIALAGNPNSGKTTMFNDLTGSSQYVGNWPGVTVEKKEGRLKGHSDVYIQDLPGIYSLSPYTLEEVIARNYLVNEKPDAIIDIIDGTNIERNLFLTTQLLELGIPMVVAVNMIDIVQKTGDTIDLKKLSRALGCEVVETSALKHIGVKAVAEAAIRAAQEKKTTQPPSVFEGTVEHAIAHVEESIQSAVPAGAIRWYGIKVFERDEKVLEQIKLPKDVRAHLEEHIADCEKALDDDAESIITNQRYAYVAKLVESTVVKNKTGQKLTTSDKIDLVVTNRILALPIFIVVMFCLYYVAVYSVGTIVTDYTNDVIFGEWIIPAAANFMESLNVAEWLSGLVVEGIISGVGAVLGFVPQMIVLFILLALLEEVGYMARVAFIMDRIFRKFGLSGKSFIPMLIGSGCSVPAIMASRTIENERDRRMTIMTTAFIPCGAKLPIIALIGGAIFGDAWWLSPLCYFGGVTAVIVSGIILKKTKMFAGDPAPFVMELPSYHFPSLGNVFRSTWERASSFIVRAGTVILLASIFIWFTSSYGWVDGQYGAVENTDESMLGRAGSVVAPVFSPLGFGDWQATVTTVMGLVAKEEVVGSLGTLMGVEGDALEMVEEGDYEGLGAIADRFTPLSAVTFLLFNLLCAPCFAAIGAIRREMNNRKWTFFAIGYMTIFAYVIAFIVFQLGTLFGGGSFTALSAVAIALTLAFLFLLFRPNPNAQDDSSSAVTAAA